MRQRTWRAVALTSLFSVPATARDAPHPTAPAGAAESARIAPSISPADLVRQLAAARGIVPLPATPYVRPAVSRLGQALAVDKILSGTRDISCMTCHLPAFGTGDRRSLSVGQGGIGLGPGRAHPGAVFIPRNAPYPGPRFDDMTIAHASNAIAGFVVDQLTFDDTPWDRFLTGRDDALTPAQLDGAQTFLSLKCSICHNGSTLSDEHFHDVAVAQIGPGVGDRPRSCSSTTVLSSSLRCKVPTVRNVPNDQEVR